MCLSNSMKFGIAVKHCQRERLSNFVKMSPNVDQHLANANEKYSEVGPIAVKLLSTRLSYRAETSSLERCKSTLSCRSLKKLQNEFSTLKNRLRYSAPSKFRSLLSCPSRDSGAPGAVQAGALAALDEGEGAGDEEGIAGEGDGRLLDDLREGVDLG